MDLAVAERAADPSWFTRSPTRTRLVGRTFTPVAEIAGRWRRDQPARFRLADERCAHLAPAPSPPARGRHRGDPRKSPARDGARLAADVRIQLETKERRDVIAYAVDGLDQMNDDRNTGGIDGASRFLTELLRGDDDPRRLPGRSDPALAAAIVDEVISRRLGIGQKSHRSRWPVADAVDQLGDVLGDRAVADLLASATDPRVVQDLLYHLQPTRTARLLLACDDADRGRWIGALSADLPSARRLAEGALPAMEQVQPGSVAPILSALGSARQDRLFAYLPKPMVAEMLTTLGPRELLSKKHVRRADASTRVVLDKEEQALIDAVAADAENWQERVQKLAVDPADRDRLGRILGALNCDPIHRAKNLWTASQILKPLDERTRAEMLWQINDPEFRNRLRRGVEEVRDGRLTWWRETGFGLRMGYRGLGGAQPGLYVRSSLWYTIPPLLTAGLLVATDHTFAGLAGVVVAILQYSVGNVPHKQWFQPHQERVDRQPRSERSQRYLKFSPGMRRRESGALALLNLGKFRGISGGVAWAPATALTMLVLQPELNRLSGWVGALFGH